MLLPCPLFAQAGLYKPVNAGIAGLATVALRAIAGVGYTFGETNVFRRLGALFHVPEIYLLYLVGSWAASLLAGVDHVSVIKAAFNL